jgi:acyl-coenzyme A thioesterase PaaI-like protein
MQHTVTGKQHNSKMCFVCGLKNIFGLKTAFYETDNKQLVALFTPRDEHQSYPDRLHGGIATTILDETIGRAISVGREEQLWGVTLDLQTRFIKPVPLNVELKVVARITKEDRRFFEGTGELLLPNGEVAVTGSGRYLKMPIHKIANFDAVENEWQIIAQPGDPQYIELPELPA